MITNSKTLNIQPDRKTEFFHFAEVLFSHLFRFSIIISICLAAFNLNAGTIEIEWDPPLTGETSGYKVYYGPSSGDYQWTKDAGAATSTILTDLDDCTTYFWAIKAYNSEGEESEQFSNELSGWPRPSIEIIDPDSGEQGGYLNIVIKGANYSEAPLIEIDNPGIKVLSTSQLGCNEIAVTIQIDPESEGMNAAAIGTFDLTVINQDMVYGTMVSAFTITLNRSRLDLDMSNRIDGLDLNRFAMLFGLDEQDADYNPDCDFTGDGWIDGEDLSHLASNFGLSL